MNQERHYYRCSDCLSVWVTDEHFSELACGACGGSSEYMGRVERGHLHVGTATPCNTLCTDAAGPNCNCSCGGENHGLGLRADVDVTTPIPVARIQSNPKRLAQVKEYQAERDRLLELVRNDDAYRRRKSGEYVSFEEFRRYLDCVEALRGIRMAGEARTHAARMLRLSHVKEAI